MPLSLRHSLTVFIKNKHGKSRHSDVKTTVRFVAGLEALRLQKNSLNPRIISPLPVKYNFTADLLFYGQFLRRKSKSKRTFGIWVAEDSGRFWSKWILWKLEPETTWSQFGHCLVTSDKMVFMKVWGRRSIWCNWPARRDSNARPAPSEGATLSNWATGGRGSNY